MLAPNYKPDSTKPNTCPLYLTKISITTLVDFGFLIQELEGHKKSELENGANQHNTHNTHDLIIMVPQTTEMNIFSLW